MSEVSTSALKRLGLIFCMVFLAVFATNLVTPHIANIFPIMENALVETLMAILIMALILLVLLRKTKSGKDIVVGR